MFFSGAALSPFVWNSLDELAVAETGFRVPMLTGLGATETSPFFMSVRPDTSRSGHVGLPVSGNDAKLLPNNGKIEVRAKGPNVTPGYWRQPELTAAAFDEEGFYKFGDALKPADADDFDAGFDFDGRIAEDFKLASGTWVSVGPLRARFVAACAPLVRDVVIAGINRDELSALVVLDLDGCRLINPDAAARRYRRRGSRSAGSCRVPRTLCKIPRQRHRLVDPHHARGPVRYAAVDRSRRSHRQGLDQPARGAGASRRADRGDLFTAPSAQIIALS